MSQDKEKLRYIISEIRRSISMTVAATVDVDLKKALTVVLSLDNESDESARITKAITMGAVIKTIEAKTHEDTVEMCSMRTLLSAVYNLWNNLESTLNIETVIKFIGVLKKNDSELVRRYQEE